MTSKGLRTWRRSCVSATVSPSYTQVLVTQVRFTLSPQKNDCKEAVLLSRDLDCTTLGMEEGTESHADHLHISGWGEGWKVSERYHISLFLLSIFPCPTIISPLPMTIRIPGPVTSHLFLFIGPLWFMEKLYAAYLKWFIFQWFLFILCSLTVSCFKVSEEAVQNILNK